jgi:enamidase
LSSYLRVENFGVLASGDVQEPRLSADMLYVADGAIAAVGRQPALDPEVHQVFDAQQMLVAPGLWDVDHRLYFGDHTPQFDARSYLAATVRAGTTHVVAPGPVDLAGVPRDPETARYLALLTQRSWLHDRPLDLKVTAGSLAATSGLQPDDFERLVAEGITQLSFVDALPTTREARTLAEWARAAGMLVVARCNGLLCLAEDATSIREALQAIGPDLVLGVNGSPVPPPDEVVTWLVERTTCGIGLATIGNVRCAQHVTAHLAKRDELARLLIGTGTPSPLGILPGGIQRMLQYLVGAAPGLTPEVLLACASGNAARCFRRPGGCIGPGQPADLIVARAAAGGQCHDALEALAHGEWLEIDTVLLDGQVRVSGRARLDGARPALVNRS